MCNRIDREDIAMQLVSGMGTEQETYRFGFLVQALCEAGRYGEAADLYQLTNSQSAAANDDAMPAHAAFAAAMTGRPELLRQIMHDQTALAAQNLTDVFQLYDDAIEGRKTNIPIGDDSDLRLCWKIPVIAESDLLSGRTTYHYMPLEAMYNYPMIRLLWIIEDNYEKYDPSADEAAFYRYLEIFFSYDPWVKEAVADFHKRGGGDALIDADMLLADLQPSERARNDGVNFSQLDWRRVPTPWRVATCVDQLLREQKISKASKIASLYSEYETQGENGERISIAGELTRRVRAAQSN
jgi:hypothetical protein